MPAISPARLKRDVALLLERLGDPDVFEHELEHLMEFYADRTIRPSQSGKPASLLLAFHVPRPVLRELEVGLSRFAGEDPEGALSLAHRLWIQGVYEYMYLAIRLLDQLSEAYDPVVMRNLKNWMQATEDEALLTDVFRTASRKNPSEVFEYLEELLESKNEPQHLTALTGLIALAKYAPSENMPGIFKITALAMQKHSLVTRSRMHTLIRSLAERTSAETAFFMRQQYLVSMRPEVGRLLRQSLAYFPEDIRVDLRQMLRES